MTTCRSSAHTATLMGLSAKSSGLWHAAAVARELFLKSSSTMRKRYLGTWQKWMCPHGLSVSMRQGVLLE